MVPLYSYLRRRRVMFLRLMKVLSWIRHTSRGSGAKDRLMAERPCRALKSSVGGEREAEDGGEVRGRRVGGDWAGGENAFPTVGTKVGILRTDRMINLTRLRF
jgi:hypothetical protein